MIMITAKCIGASLGNYKAPLYTFECEIPRIIVAELNKHRALSNSIESSRAVPLEKMIDKVRDNMFIPVFTKNQAGMQGYKINKNPILSDIWEEAAMSAVDYAEELFMNHGIHKQVCNRLIENFTYVKCILSGTDWDNFFNLRIHHTAEPHIRELAIAIYKEMRATVPMKIEEGEWHVPYIERKRDQYGAIHYRHPETKESLTEDEAKDLSVAMCAQVSYRNIDSSDDKVRKVLDRLFPLNEPIHCYDKETEVLTTRGFVYWKDVTASDLLYDVDINTGEGKGFTSPISLIEGKHTGAMYSIDNEAISFSVTNNHRILGSFGKHSRGKDFVPASYRCEDVVSGKKAITLQHKALSAPIVNTPLAPEGQLIGFYVGDGFRIDNTIAFHYKKERKHKFLTGVLDSLGTEYSVRINNDGSYFVRVYKCGITDRILTECTSGSKDKRLGTWDVSLYTGIFDGLKNSDGGIKRNTWKYATASERLKTDILNAAPLAGVTVRENATYKGVFQLMVMTDNYVMLNDSRRENSYIQETQCVDEPVYCATMPSGGLVVRRHGKTWVSGNSVPCEHVATPADIMEDAIGNFYGWIQYRHTIENNTCYNFTHEVFEKRINEINKLMGKDSKMSSDMFTPVEDFSIAYPWAVEYMNKQASIFWPAHEVKVEKDIHDIQTNCTEAERHAIMETLRLFTKYEQIIGEESWTGRFANTFKRHELVSMATLFGAMELSVHKIFYSKINDLLNAADPDFYTSWKEDPTLTERMNQITAILDHPRDAVYLGGFALLEGAVLYSSFAFLKHFQVNGKNKMVHTVSGINFSSRDENLHCHAAAHVFREFTLSEQDRVDLIVLSHNIRENEYAIIDKLFEKGEIEGITAQDLKQFVKHRVSFVMNLLGLVEEVEDAGVVGEWYYPSVDSFKMNDFFITTNNEYLRKFREEDFTWE